MKSMQHVFWRGVLALGLMAIGVGSGIGMPPAATGAIAETTACQAPIRILVVHGGPAGTSERVIAKAFLARRDAGPAMPKS